MSELPSGVVSDLVNADALLLQYSTRVKNQPYDKQKKINKILLEEMGGEESEYESDLEELTTPED